jgi:hypothetical protein
MPSPGSATSHIPDGPQIWAELAHIDQQIAELRPAIEVEKAKCVRQPNLFRPASVINT